MNANDSPGAPERKVADEIAERVLIERALLLCRYSAVPLIGTVFAGGMLCSLLAMSNGWARAGTWYGLLLLCTALRAVAVRNYLARPHNAVETRRWLRLMVALILLAGSTWSLSGTWLVPADRLQEVMVLFMLFFVATVGMGSLSPINEAYVAFLVPIILPIAVHQFLQGGDERVLMAITSPVFIAIMLAIGRRQSERMGSLMRLTFEKEMLVAKLLEERDTVSRINRDLELRSASLAGVNRELESFSYSIAHDLRTPLRAINGFASVLHQGNAARLDEEGRNCVAAIRDRTLRMSELIDDLLALAHLGRQVIALREVDMTSLASTAAKNVIEAYSAAPVAKMTIDPLPVSVGDPSMLLQLWSNLIENAVKYSSKSESPTVTITGRVDGGSVEYTVADNGTGFDMSYYDQLFGVFKRLHRSDEYPGTGVGLAIVQRIVTRHGGRVWAEGEPGKGARFSFSLPLVPAVPA